MNLNWILEVWIDLILAISFLFGSIITAFRAKKAKPLLFFSFTWLFFSLFFLLEAISYLLLSIELARIYSILFFPATVFLVISIDYSKKESIGIFKMSFTCALGCLEIYLAFQPNAIIKTVIDGESIIVWNGEFLIVTSLMILIFVIFLLDWVGRTFINAPKQLKKESSIFLLGAILVGPINLLLFFFSYTLRILIIFADIFLLIGMIITIYILIKEPKLFYILPFTAYRITVIHNNSGFPLFDYKWAETNINEDLLSGFMQVSQNLSLKLLEKGELKDFQLEKAVLIFQKSKNITVGLLSTNSSKFLRDCLEGFTEEFENEFKDIFNNTPIDSPIDTSKFNSAYILIESYFSYVPSRLSE